MTQGNDPTVLLKATAVMSVSDFFSMELQWEQPGK